MASNETTLEQGQVPESQSTPEMAMVQPMGEHASIDEHDSDATTQAPSIIFESIEVDVCYVLPHI
jgi:hypothetical protein